MMEFRRIFVEIERIAQFCMHIEHFAKLSFSQKVILLLVLFPTDLCMKFQWAIFSRFWLYFFELERVYATCEFLGSFKKIKYIKFYL